MSQDLVVGFGGAALGAAISGVASWWTGRPAQISAQKQELRSLVLQFFDIRREQRSPSVPIADKAMMDLYLGELNYQRVLQLEECEKILKEIPEKQVSSSEFSVIAEEYTTLSNFSRAEYYFKRAVAVAEPGFTTVIAYRNLASFYFYGGPLKNYRLGREEFQKAIDLLNNPQDDYSIFTLGYTYESWGGQELYQNFTAEAAQAFNRARKFYLDLDDRNPLKARALDRIDEAIRNISNPQGVAAPPGPTTVQTAPNDPNSAPSLNS